MKKVLYIFMLCFLIKGPLLAAEKLILSAAQTSNAADVAFEVLKVAYGQLGIDVQRKTFPGERALNYSNSGKTSGMDNLRNLNR